MMCVGVGITLLRVFVCVRVRVSPAYVIRPYVVFVIAFQAFRRCRGTARKSEKEGNNNLRIPV